VLRPQTNYRVYGTEPEVQAAFSAATYK